jgi:hypothetical protein
VAGNGAANPQAGTREKGWRAFPLWDQATTDALSVRRLPDHIVLGFGVGNGANVPAIAQGSRALLAQEIRSARGGRYTFTVRASGGGAEHEPARAQAADFEKVFLANFTCRLLLFRFVDSNKDPRHVDVLASADFRPAFSEGKEARTYAIERFLGSTQPGVNFPIGNGLGVAVVVEKTAAGELRLTGPEPKRGFVRIHSVSLEFNARPRDDAVVV